MTKLRPPLTFEAALTRVADGIGWGKAAEIVGASERTVRSWSETELTAGIKLDAALKLDVAYLASGGDVPPFHQCFTLRIETDTAEACADYRAIGAAAAAAAKESGEAIAAAITAAQPGATPTEIARAELELEESIRAQTNTLATLRAGRRADVSSPGGETR